MERTQLSMVDENGNEVLYDILLTFDSEEFNKSYILIAPSETSDDDEDVEVLAYSFTEKEEDGSIEDLFPVETDEEWDMIEEVFNTRLDSEDFDDLDDEDYEEYDEEEDDDQ